MRANERKFDELLQKIDIIIKLMGTNMLNNYKTNKDKILFLSSIGFKPAQIINLTEIPKKTVYNVLSDARKKEEKSGE